MNTKEEILFLFKEKSSINHINKKDFITIKKKFQNQ